MIASQNSAPIFITVYRICKASITNNISLFQVEKINSNIFEQVGCYCYHYTKHSIKYIKYDLRGTLCSVVLTQGCDMYTKSVR